MPIYDSFEPKKIACCTPDIIAYFISISSVNHVSNLNTPSLSLQVILLTSDDHDTYHIIIRDKHDHSTNRIGYWFRWNNVIRCYNKYRLYLYTYYINKRFYYCHVHAIMKSKFSSCFIKHLHCMTLHWFYWYVCLPYFRSFANRNRSCACFITFLLIPLWSNPYILSAWNFDIFLLLSYVWICVMIALSDSSSVLTISIPIT